MEVEIYNDKKKSQTEIDLDKDAVKKAIDYIEEGFIWRKTKEGEDYWKEVHDKLSNLLEDDEVIYVDLVKEGGRVYLKQVHSDGNPVVAPYIAEINTNEREVYLCNDSKLEDKHGFNFKRE